MQFVCVILFLATLITANGFISNGRKLEHRIITPHMILGNIFQVKESSNQAMKSRYNELKQKITNLASTTNNGITATENVKKEIDNLVAALLETNKSIAKRPSNAIKDQLDGKWELLYSTSKEASAGKLGPFIGKVTQQVDCENIQYLNKLRLWDGLFEAKLAGTFEVTPTKSSALPEIRVIFRRLTFNLFGVRIVEKNVEGQVGIWRNVLLDDTWRIFYAKNAKTPNAKENLYILRREE